MDRNRPNGKAYLSLVGSEDIQSLESSRKLEFSKDAMEKARQSSKALGWLYATVELGWRFLVRSKSENQNLMGEAGSASFNATEEIPENGLGLSKTLNIVENELVPGLVKTQSPQFLGHMTSDIPFPVHLADILSSFFNQNLVKSETAGSASDVERQTLSWFHRLTYGFEDSYYEKVTKHPDKSLGVVVSGGTIGNITALTVARNLVLPESKALGVYEAMKLHGWNKAVILCSERAHYSLKKAAALIGLGEHNLIKIPVVESTNKIDLEKLERKLLEFKQQRTLVISIVGVAGSTETGSVDDLNQIARLAKKFKVWFHVDAAWGGAYLLSNSLKKILSGIEQADSVVIDGHKLLGLTMGHGMTLFKNEFSLESIKQSAKYIIRANSFDLGKYSIEGSKPFASFKLWFLLKTVGLKKLAAKIEKTHEQARLFENLLKEFPSLEQTSELETNILTYRFAPVVIKNFITVNEKSNESIWLENTLNRINIKLHEQGADNSPGFVSRTTLESCAGSDIPQVVLRAIPINTSTKPKHMRNLIVWQINLGWKLLSDAIVSGPYDNLKVLINR